MAHVNQETAGPATAMMLPVAPNAPNARKKDTVKMIAATVRHVTRFLKSAVVEQSLKRAATPLVISRRGTETVAIRLNVMTNVLLVVVVVVVVVVTPALAIAEQSSFAVDHRHHAHLGALAVKLGVSVEEGKTVH